MLRAGGAWGGQVDSGGALAGLKGVVIKRQARSIQRSEDAALCRARLPCSLSIADVEVFANEWTVTRWASARSPISLAGDYVGYKV